VRYAFQLTEFSFRQKRECIFDICRAEAVVAQLIWRVVSQAQPGAGQSEADIPAEAPVAPECIPIPRFPGMAEELASQLYDNLHGKLMALPDFCEVYPAHGAGSLCGRAMGAKRTSTIGYERKRNAALQTGDKSAFIASLTTDMPSAPDHFARCSAVNGSGPALVRTLPVPEPMSAEAFAQRARKPGALVLDVRPFDAFGGQHIPGAWSIDINGNFATFAGWTLPVDGEILLVADSEAVVSSATVWLHRVGIDRVTGYLEGGMLSWNLAGLPTERVDQMSPQEFDRLFKSGREMILVDARSPQEFQALHLPGALNIPAPDTRSRFNELPGGKTICIICSTGLRSNLAASILQSKGLKDVRSVAGGMTGYMAAGLI